jgi:glycosyltransferase involved in cell wall biosynthesis
MPAIKLLLLTNRYPAHRDDGASPFAANFAARLSSHDIDCTVVTPFHRASRYDDPAVVRFAWGEEKRTIGSLPLLLPSTWKKISAYFQNGYNTAATLHRERGFDFCLALWAAPSGLIARRLKREHGLPYAVWCLGSDIHTYARLPIIGRQIAETLRQSDRLFSDGHRLGQMAQKLSGCRYYFLPTMRRVTEFPFTTGQQERLLICPGRLEKSKGVFDLADAIYFMGRQFSGWSLYFIGEGSAKKSLQRRINACGLGESVRLMGFLPAQEMFRLVSLSTAVIIPTHADSLPLTFGEAMQLGKPVVATDVGDLKYFIEKYRVGAVAPARKPFELARAIINLLGQGRDFRPGCSACARELDIDSAGDQFAGWLRNHLAHKFTPEPVEAVC